MDGRLFFGITMLHDSLYPQKFILRAPLIMTRTKRNSKRKNIEELRTIFIGTLDIMRY
jgi:hypothetical protein